jgi:hypothetical protein
MQRMDFLQADNQMTTFAKETGACRSSRGFTENFQVSSRRSRSRCATSIRLHTRPLTPRGMEFRKIKVQLVNPATNELFRVVDEKGKPIKYQTIAKAGYTAPREVD